MSMSPEDRQATGFEIRGRTAKLSCSSSVSLFFLGLVFSSTGSE